MPIPNIDLDSMTLEEMNQLIQLLQSAYFTKVEEQQNVELQNKRKIAEARQTLVDLLGPDDAPPYDPNNPDVNKNVTAVSRHDADGLGAYSGLALDLSYEAMTVLLRTLITVVDVLGQE